MGAVTYEDGKTLTAAEVQEVISDHSNGAFFDAPIMKAMNIALYNATSGICHQCGSRTATSWTEAMKSNKDGKPLCFGLGCKGSCGGIQMRHFRYRHKYRPDFFGERPAFKSKYAKFKCIFTDCCIDFQRELIWNSKFLYYAMKQESDKKIDWVNGVE